MKNTKIYVAASFEDRQIVSQIEQSLIIKGYEIVSNWTDHLNLDKADEYAEEDLNNIKQADLLIMYNSNLKTTGKFIEVGMAIMKNIPVIVIGNSLTSVFKKYVKNYPLTWVSRLMLDEELNPILRYILKNFD
jgi:nucleoside 2-deoxyribosyltransferase